MGHSLQFSNGLQPFHAEKAFGVLEWLSFFTRVQRSGFSKRLIDWIKLIHNHYATYLLSSVSIQSSCVVLQITQNYVLI